MLTTSWHPSTWFLSTQLLGVHLLLLVVHFQLALQEVCCLRWTNGMLILFHLFTGGIRYLVLGCAYQLSYHASTFPENDCSILLPADWRLVQQGQDDHGQGWCGSSRLPQRTSLLQKNTTLLNNDFAFTISQSTCNVIYSEHKRQNIVRDCCRKQKEPLCRIQ